MSESAAVPQHAPAASERTAFSPDWEPPWRVQLASAIACGACGLAAAFVAPESLRGPLWIASYVLGAWTAALEAFESMRKFRLDVHFLMLVVAVGAAMLGQYAEGAILLFLFSFSGALEEFAEARTEMAISSLLKHAPREATILTPEGAEKTIAVDSLAPGMTIRLRPGDRVPADARIVAGTSSFDESMLTGEAVPVSRTIGDEIAAGSQASDGGVDAAVIRPPGESALQRMVKLVLEARERRAPSQRFTDKLGTGYSLAIIGGSAAYGLILVMLGATKDVAIYRAMTLLVVASPCALVLSIPSAILAAIAAGARKGVLFRGGAPVENLVKATAYVFDKTGTLTTGELALKKIELAGDWTEEQALAQTAAAELRSEHPIARAIIRGARARGIEPMPPDEFRAVPGAGIESHTAGTTLFVGTREFVRNSLRGTFPQSWALVEPGAREIRVFSGTGHKSAMFVFEDQPRPDAMAFLDRLRAEKKRIVLLTGDHAGPANALAKELGIEEVHARATPEIKLEFVAGLAAKGERLVMVGDGINDAAALANAEVSVVMGRRGSDAAIEQAGIVLSRDSFVGLGDAITLSGRARRIIAQNLSISIGAMIVLALSAIFGGLALPFAVMGHEGSTVLVCLNSLRLLLPSRVSPPAA